MVQPQVECSLVSVCPVIHLYLCGMINILNCGQTKLYQILGFGQIYVLLQIRWRTCKISSHHDKGYHKILFAFSACRFEESDLPLPPTFRNEIPSYDRMPASTNLSLASDSPAEDGLNYMALFLSSNSTLGTMWY